MERILPGHHPLHRMIRNNPRNRPRPAGGRQTPTVVVHIGKATANAIIFVEVAGATCRGCDTQSCPSAGRHRRSVVSHGRVQHDGLSPPPFWSRKPETAFGAELNLDGLIHQHRLALGHAPSRHKARSRHHVDTVNVDRCGLASPKA